MYLEPDGDSKESQIIPSMDEGRSTIVQHHQATYFTVIADQGLLSVR